MVECRHCREFFRASMEAMGARCPSCRLPLYERVDPPQPAAPAGGEVPRCLTHPHSQAIGTCQNCGVPLCAVCRTRWRDRFLCLGCLERTLEERPQEAGTLRRQALLSVVLGLAAWLFMLLGGWAMLSGAGLPPRQQLLKLGQLLILASFVPALFGVGQGSAAVRGCSQRLRLAICGLLLSASHLGLMIGLLLFNTFHN